MTGAKMTVARMTVAKALAATARRPADCRPGRGSAPPGGHTFPGGAVVAGKGTGTRQR